MSFINKSLGLEWTAELLNKKKFNLCFILMNKNDSGMEDFLKSKGLKTYRLKYSGKENIFRTIFRIRKILKAEKADIVHTHLFDASLAGLTAAKFAGVKRRIYTRHNSTLHHIYHKSAVKYDRIINDFSTDIVAVSAVTKNVLTDMEGVSPKKITLIHHGFLISDFDAVSVLRVKAVRDKYNINGKSPVIGVISRYIHWKGVQFIIPAFEKILKQYPGALLVLANATGSYKNEIIKLLNKLPPGSFISIEFEPDVIALYKCFDIFIHTPVDATSEAFGQVYVEAMASKIPCIVTLSGIANEYVIDWENALVVPYNDTESIFTRAVELLSGDALKQKIIANAYRDVVNLFPVEKMIKELEELYLKPAGK